MSLQKDIDRGLEIKRVLAALKEELEAIQERVDKVALNGPQVPLEDAERDGMQYLARGSEMIVPVVITADFLTKSFAAQTPKHTEILDTLATPAVLNDFFRRKTTFERIIEDGKEFRQAARDIVGDGAEAFIKACVSRDKDGIAKSAVKIAWDRARPLNGMEGAQ